MNDDIEVGDRVAYVGGASFIEIAPGDTGTAISATDLSVCVHFDKWNHGVQPNEFAMERVGTHGKPCNRFPRNVLSKAGPACMFGQGGT